MKIIFSFILISYLFFVENFAAVHWGCNSKTANKKLKDVKLTDKEVFMIVFM
jgi:hypothetical protein